MKFAVVVLACVLAAANAQFNRASAFASVGNFPQQNQYKAQQYKPQPYKAQQYKPQPYKAPPQAYNPPTNVYKATVNKPAVPARAAAVAVVPVATKNYYAGASSGDASANTLKIGNDVNSDGSFAYFFETDNGIAAQAQGSPRNYGGNPPAIADVVQGSFSWKSPEGQDVSITYVADENGYQPQGAAIPTSPPIPPQIARALEYIARSGKN